MATWFGGAALVERETELAQIEAALGSAAGASGAGLLIAGPAGIGKSRLVAAARDRARERGLRVCGARGIELEQEFGFGVVRQLLEREVAARKDPELFAGAAAHARAIFDVAGPAAPPPAGFAVLHGLYWLVMDLAGDEPLVLVVDDVHWADASSQRFLSFLAARLEGTGVALLLAERTGNASHNPDWSAGLERAAQVQIAAPQPLSVDGIATLIRAVTPDPDADRFAAEIARLSAGNPLLALDLVRAAQEAGIAATGDPSRLHELGAPDLARSVLSHLRELGDEAVQVARAVAVLGSSATSNRLARLTDLGTPAVEATLEALAAAQILTRADAAPDFVHPLVRKAVADAQPPSERSRMHAAAAALLRAEGSAVELVAAHLATLAPCGDAQVAADLEAAGAVAMGRGAPLEAARLFARAVREPPPPEHRAGVLAKLGIAELLVGSPDAREHLQEAIELAPPGPPQVAIARPLASLLAARGEGLGAIEVLEGTLAHLAPGDDLALVVEAELAFVAMMDARLVDQVRDRLDRRPEPAGQTPGERLLLGAIAFWGLLEGRAPEEIFTLGRRALAGGQLLYDQAPESPVFPMTLNVISAAGHNDERRPLVNLMIEDARARGSLLSLSVGLTQRAGIALFQGRLADAEADVREALAHAEAVGFRAIIPVVAGVAAVIVLARTGPDAAEELLREHGVEELAAGPSLDALFLEWRAEVRLAAGRPREALADLRAAGAQREPFLSERHSLTSAALLALGDRTGAEQEASAALERAQARGLSAPLAAALRAVAAVNEPERALELLGEARAIYERIDYHTHAAETRVAEATLLRQTGEIAKARSAFFVVLEFAQAAGARPLEERARMELSALGGRPAPRSTSGPDALTPSERRVATIAATGLSNRQIAQQLFVTEKTVEVHLTKAYKKLGIRSRADLGAALAG